MPSAWRPEPRPSQRTNAITSCTCTASGCGTAGWIKRSKDCVTWAQGCVPSRVTPSRKPSGSLVLHIPDGFLDGVTRLGTQPCAQVTQSLERLIHPAVPQPEAVQVQLVIALVR